MRQRSIRNGLLPRRTVKRVYLPMRPAWVTRTSSTAPPRSVCSNLRKRTSAALRATGPSDATFVCRFLGQPAPRHATSMRAVFGALISSTRSRAPDEVNDPAIRTTGKGLISAGRTTGAGVIGRQASRMMASATVDAPLALVARRSTRWGPAVANETVAVGPVASANLPSSLRSHARLVIGPLGSLEVENRVIVSPVSGELGV